MPHKKRTAEEVCIAYARAAQVVRELTKKIVPGECVHVASYEPPKYGLIEHPVACISKLFSVKGEPDGYGGSTYQGDCDEIESEMCERCLESLKAVRDRKKARIRLGAAKRAVESIGKRKDSPDA